MSLFIIILAIGLTGMLTMALPGMARHGHAGAHLSHAGHGHVAAHGPAHGAAQSAVGGKLSLARFVPSPRVIFSLMTLFGAFGYGFREGLHLPALLAAACAAVPAYLVERYAVEPYWNLLLGFQAEPQLPLDQLLLTEAEAVTPFTNGKGIVRVVREGRDVQFSARLPESQAAMPVRVGDRLRVEEVDPAHERLTVSVK